MQRQWCTVNSKGVGKSKQTSSIIYSFLGLIPMQLSGLTFVPYHIFLLFLSVNIAMFWWKFQACLHNLIKFQVLYNTSMFPLCSKSQLNYRQESRKCPTQSQAHGSRHESACHNRQLCGLSTDSLALSFIQSRYTVPFLCIMYHVYGVLWVKQFHHRGAIMEKKYFMIKGHVKFYRTATTKNI
jgi:hypothetical protein